MGVVLAVHTAGCGSTEPPAGNRSEPPVSDEAEQNGVGNQEDNMSAEDRAQMETADTDGSNILIAYFTAGENSDVDVVSSASVTTVDGEAKGRLRAVADMIQTQTGGTLFSHTFICWAVQVPLSMVRCKLIVQGNVAIIPDSP